MLKGQCKGAKLVYQAEKKNLHCKSDELLHSKEEQNNKPHLHLNLCLLQDFKFGFIFFLVQVLTYLSLILASISLSLACKGQRID